MVTATESPPTTRTSTGRRLAAVAVWCAAWLPALAAVVGSVHLGTSLVSRDLWVQLSIAVVYGAVGAALLSRRTTAAGLIVAAFAIGAGLVTLGMQYAGWAQQVGGLPGEELMASLVRWGTLPGIAALAVLPWLFAEPGGRVRVWGLRTGWSITAVMAVSVFLYPSADNARPSTWAQIASIANLLGISAAMLAFVAGIGHLWWSWRSEAPEGRRGLPSLATGAVLTVVSLVIVIIGGGTPATPLAVTLQVVPLVLGQGLLGTALLVVVLGRGLWGLDLALSRIAVAGLVTTVAIGAYAAVVLLAGWALPIRTEIAGLVGVALVALGVEPLRRWTHRRVDRLIYGAAADPAALVRNLGRQVGAGTGSGVNTLTEELAHGLRLDRVQVLPAGAGTPPAAVVLTLESGGVSHGKLVATPRSGELVDRRLAGVLAEVAPFLALAVRLDRLHHDVRRAQDRLVQVRHEERRLLRRELHDGLGPALAGIGLGLGAVDNLLTAHPDQAHDLLEVLRTEVERRTGDIRDLARTMLPPALDEGRLEQALTELAERFSDSGLQFTVDADGVDGLDTTRQLAIYHIAAEAALNIRRHSRADRGRITVAASDKVRLTVEDNGSGWSGQPSEDGVGVNSMRERAAELGGTLTIRSRPEGGTVLVVELP